MKIIRIIGRLIKADRAITERELFSFVRVMIEVFIKKEFSKCIEFIDEWGYEVLVFCKRFNINGILFYVETVEGWDMI